MAYNLAWRNREDTTVFLKRKRREKGKRKPRCVSCSILLESKYAGVGNEKYCEGCLRMKNTNRVTN